MELAPTWCDLVFHVLAHVSTTYALPASLFDPHYVTFAEKRLGSTRERSLGSDVELLGKVLATHDALARVQWLALLFEDEGQAAGAVHREIGELAAEEVASPVALRALGDAGPAVELLRAAAELEAEHHARLPPAAFDALAVAESLAVRGPAAPWLSRVSVFISRALRLRGRAFESRIIVGCPCSELELGVEHVAWQAAHEATVLEVQAGSSLPERAREHVALVLLSERARRAGQADEHRKWYAHFGPSAPRLDTDSLAPGPKRIFEDLLGD